MFVAKASTVVQRNYTVLAKIAVLVLDSWGFGLSQTRWRIAVLRHNGGVHFGIGLVRVFWILFAEPVASPLFCRLLWRYHLLGRIDGLRPGIHRIQSLALLRVASIGGIDNLLDFLGGAGLHANCLRCALTPLLGFLGWLRLLCLSCLIPFYTVYGF